MPLYEYQCENCGERFEVMQKFSDEPLTVHEKCGGKVERLLSAPAIQFKGSGWYVTDYARSSNTATANNGEGKKAEAPSSTASSPSDSGTTSSTSSDKASASSDTKKE
ncbi:MAG: zinc ribbon domain-containing protein [Acidobacteriaceae bacterium]|nr:zinc ribbon domain-containing protein [Acidobacteriaceae bacterium]